MDDPTEFTTLDAVLAWHRDRRMFEKVTLRGVDLSRAELPTASFLDVRFEGVTLRGAQLAGCVLERVVFAGCALGEVDLRGAMGHSVDFGADADTSSNEYCG